MRIAIFSDVHGNLQAVDAVLADIDTGHVDATYCLGDLVGYSASPNTVTFLNVGSVGKPKDGDWRACFSILDGSLEFRRVTSDVRTAAEAIRETYLPHEFADDIESGGAPRQAGV